MAMSGPVSNGSANPEGLRLKSWRWLESGDVRWPQKLLKILSRIQYYWFSILLGIML